ncbi:TAXI family TRAP transporter solute-binding subunit [Isoptericola sp. 178]|uniref:TAXI family TRAP transporter solute-binding subunit n=1 Tax=Isoptericola sp. 178 TaxID=3064651 RepID=UPI002713445F|nr:TAXI family TRAP transporter solute-binding subunit [Isoptericola sp. 178]MDO8143601.1 TAXI family TRAP transporter solute-binding subunit [Isoptericola sp. 178]
MTRRVGRSLTAAVLVLVVLAGCFATEDTPGQGRLPDRIIIATGGTTGIYHGYGRALAEVLEDRHGVETEVLTTGGSVENLELLAAGEAQVAFSAADAVADAVHGTGAFDEPVDLRALGRVYDDFAHLVVPADSPVRELSDLRGLRVSVGAPRSGTSLIARRVLAAGELPESALRVLELGITESLDALGTGRIDAFFWSGGLRTPGLIELAEETPVRLVPLDGVVDELREQFGQGYRHGTVPEGIYGLDADVETLAVPNVLVVPASLPEEAAYALVATLFAARSELAEQVASAAMLDRTRVIYTEPAALHAGALRYYRDVKD